MSEQQPTTTSSDSTEQGMDRRKFLLRTTAITAGAWAAPSILTIDRAFGAEGSPCRCPEASDAATAKGTVVLGLTDTVIPIRANACLNDDDLGVGPVTLPGGLGTIEAGDAQCTCGAVVNVALVNLVVGGQPVTAEALKSNAACDCNAEETDPDKTTGGSTVYNLQVGPVGPITSSTFQEIPLPGGLGVVRLNEDPSTGADPGEFNAVRIIFNDPLGDSIDLKLASAKVTCA